MGIRTCLCKCQKGLFGVGHGKGGQDDENHVVQNNISIFNMTRLYFDEPAFLE